MARPRAATYDDQRERILRQAAELFARQGFSGTSMNEVAQACGVSKAALYHYVRDKSELLLLIAITHVERLELITHQLGAADPGFTPQQRLRRLIEGFVAEYAQARHEHRVLTEDVKFLAAEDQDRVMAAQRRVVAVFADLVAQARPDLRQAGVHRALTMLLFGMINWMFTWLRPDGALTHQQMGPLVSELFFGGLTSVTAPLAQANSKGTMAVTGSFPTATQKETPQ